VRHRRFGDVLGQPDLLEDPQGLMVGGDRAGLVVDVGRAL